ncbi:MAG: NAD(P) transhydrogenase subunit alpha [Longimicrobiales bacterium]
MIESLLIGLYVFVLAMFVGFEVITKVPTILHTPLMSGSNAISGITIIGALLVAGRSTDLLGNTLGVIAVVFAMINVVGGFLVTDRMLKMFARRDEDGRSGAGARASDGQDRAGDAGA